jgi:hypothetical protein
VQVGVIQTPGATDLPALPWEHLSEAVLVLTGGEAAGLALATEAQRRGVAYALVLTAEPGPDTALEAVLRGAVMYEWPDVAFDTRAGDAAWAWATERVVDLSQAVLVLAEGAAADKALKLAVRTRRVVLDLAVGAWGGHFIEAQKVRATPI